EPHALPEHGCRAIDQLVRENSKRSAQLKVHQDQLTGSLLRRTAAMFSQPLRAVVLNAPANTQLNPLESRTLSLRPGRCREFRVALLATEKMSGLFRASRADRRNKNGTFPDHQNSPFASRNAAQGARHKNRGSAADRSRLQ